MDGKPSLKGACLSHVTRFKFGGPIHISEIAEARAVKFCVQGDYIKYCQRDDKSPLKGAWFGSRDPFCLCNCGLRKTSPRHTNTWDQQCRRRRASVSSILHVDAIQGLKLKLHQFVFVANLVV